MLELWHLGVALAAATTIWSRWQQGGATGPYVPGRRRCPCASGGQAWDGSAARTTVPWKGKRTHGDPAAREHEVDDEATVEAEPPEMGERRKTSSSRSYGRRQGTQRPCEWLATLLPPATSRSTDDLMERCSRLRRRTWRRWWRRRREDGGDWMERWKGIGRSKTRTGLAPAARVSTVGLLAFIPAVKKRCFEIRKKKSNGC